MSSATSNGSKSSGSSIIAAVLSFVIPGLGHYYGGLKGRGIYWFVAFVLYVFISVVLVFVGIGIVLLFLEPVFHIGSSVDAYLQTKD